MSNFFLWPMDCSPPGSSVDGTSQARILEWVTISFSRSSSWPRNRAMPWLAGRIFTSEVPGKPKQYLSPISYNLVFQMTTKPCLAHKDQSLLMLLCEENLALQWTKGLLLKWIIMKLQNHCNHFYLGSPAEGEQSHWNRKMVPASKFSFLFGDLRKLTTVPFKTFRHLTFYILYHFNKK